MIEWCVLSAIIALGLFLSAFFSGAETGLYCINRLRLQLGVQRRDPRALRLSRVLSDEPGALSVALTGTNLANYLTTSAVAYLFADQLGVARTDTELYTIAIVTPVVFVLGEMVPKNLFRLHSDTLLRRGSLLLAVFDRLFRLTGVVWVLTRLAGRINHLIGLTADDPHAFGAKRRVAILLQEALSTRTLAQDQSDLIDRVCQLSETLLHEVMVPASRVRAISADADRAALLRLARATRHPRLPVYHPNRRAVVGVINVDTLLDTEGWQRVAEHMVPATFLQPTTMVGAAITHLQHTGQSMAIVADSGGRMLGIATLNGLLQEVVGEVAGDD